MFDRSKVSSFFVKVLKSRNLPVFTVFLFLSFCFWFLNALRKDYVTNIKFPIVLTNFPEDAMPDPSAGHHVFLKVRSEGFHLLQYQFGEMFDPVEVKVDQLPTYRKGDEFGIYFLPRQFSRLFTSQLPGKLELLEIQSDTLFIPILPRKSRKVAVKPFLRVSYERQHMNSSDVAVNPDSVLVSGFAHVVDTMRWISTAMLEARNLKDTFSRQVELATAAGLQYSDKKVRVLVPVEAFTQKSVNVPVFAQHLPEKYHFKAFPSFVRVSFLVGLSRFDDIQPSDFSAVVDFSDVGISSERLKVKIEKMPQGIQSMTYSPIFVDYLIEKDRY